jgi:hypothetical protein
MIRTLTRPLALVLALCLLAPAARPAQKHAAHAGDACAGPERIVCDKGLACEFLAGKCGTADLEGECVPAPELCAELRDPVCDCSGKTYDNLCKLLKAGGWLDHRGECQKTP